jgi:glyoxylase-like metal-dependent hydrolase (beta-lactamase superfamily II)
MEETTEHHDREETKRMKKLDIATVVFGTLCLLGPATASAQVKVFWTTSGFFGPFNISEMSPAIPKEKHRDVTLPISMWIIDHPKGLVVFDTGNNVAITDNCKGYWSAGFCDFLKPSQKREDVIDVRLKKIGYSLENVTVVVTSHAHLDHIGNIEMFPNAIHVMQKKELYQMWFPEKFQGRTGPGFSSWRIWIMPGNSTSWSSKAITTFSATAAC